MHTGGQAADALRLSTPDAGAVARSLIGVLGVTAIALALGSGATAMWTLSGGVIAGAIALQRSPGGRVPLVVTGSVELAIAVLLGTLTGWHSPVFIAAVALWCFAAGMQWSLGANAGLVASAASALLVLAPPVAPTVGQALLAPVLVVLAGVVQATLIAVWPPRRWRAQRDGLTRAYRSLATDSRNVAANSAADVDDAPLTWLREVFADSQVSQRPRAYHGGYRLPERLAGTLASLHASAERDDRDDETGESATDAGLTQLLTAAAVLLDAIADHGHTARRDAEHALVRVQTAAAAVTGPDAALAQRFCEQLREAAALRFGQLHRPDLIGSLASAPAVVRSHLTWTSPILRHAIRLSVTTAVAVAAARYGGLEHAYWMPLTVVVVLRPETAHTYTRCAGRIAGLCVGIIVASVLTFMWQPGPVSSAVCALVFVGLAYGVAQFGYLAVGATVGAIVMFAVGVSASAPWSGNADRLFAVLIGGALAVMAHVALPDHALIRLRQRAGELLMTEIDYAALVIKAFVHEIDHPAEILSAAWQRAFRARAAFEAAWGATSLDPPILRRWLRSYRTALNSVTSACTTLENSLPTHPSSALHSEFVAAVDDYVEALRGAPPSPAVPWSLDTAELSAALRRVHNVASTLSADNGAARILIGELTTITRSLEEIAIDRVEPAGDSR
ncbi:FUSC family protein [Mycolicibacterium porcinum]|uniref:FUSC family protein n=2 Tax=Mycolicibacterium porcinum TaxID=39693 RepID=A0AAW5SYY7_9MYCO|nr:FUSC family protein [Mycolicibacterium porcinum]MCV7387517.1 FUSC family protein [Mycolicibacterium porcinum]ORB36340.1 FUSC family protein [Mycolicibacterium porcinum]CDO33783.1 Inner membrane protein YccS [Mycolicibacterium vulneris]